jgi:galactitol-specific phosphotransferase system IIC component
MKLTDAERKLISLNIGVDGQDDTIYETVESIITARIDSLIAKLPKEAKTDWATETIKNRMIIRNITLAEVLAMLEEAKK